jgi:hypothetical protein
MKVRTRAGRKIAGSIIKKQKEWEVFNEDRLKAKYNQREWLVYQYDRVVCNNTLTVSLSK